MTAREETDELFIVAKQATTQFAEMRRERDQLRDEVERLKNGGCARDQRTTQFCAEAVALRAELAEAEMSLRVAETWESDCGICGAHTECGDIPHNPSCPVVLARDFLARKKGETK
jgi:hypothetical protein